jgi:phage gp36-like protein
VDKHQEFSTYIRKEILPLVIKRGLTRMLLSMSGTVDPEAVQAYKEEVQLWRDIADKAIELGLDNDD